MTHFAHAVKRASREAIFIYLLVTVAIGIFFTIIWFVPFEGQVEVWPLALLSKPWGDIFNMLLIQHPAPPRWMPAMHSGSVAISVALNAALVYAVGRFIWLLVRPNNSFKPKPLRGSA